MSSSSIDLGISRPASGSTATMSLLTGYQGQMFYNTTYNAMFMWTVDRWLPAGTPDPRYGYILFDEFIGSDRIGMLDWAVSGAAPNAQGNELNPGIYKFAPSTAATTHCLYSQTNSIQFGTADLYAETNILIPALSNGTDNFVASFGWGDVVTYNVHGDQTDGATICYDNSVATASWVCKTFASSASSSFVSSVNAVANTWTRLGVLISANSSAKFYVNGSLVGTITTNIATGSNATGPIFKVDKTAGNGSVNMQADYYYSYGFFNGARVP